jgi:hypothetical protein
VGVDRLAPDSLQISSAGLRLGDARAQKSPDKKHAEIDRQGRGARGDQV